MTDDIVARLRAYDGRMWETTACYNGLREEAAAVLEQGRGDARTFRGFVATYKMTPSMMASRAEIAEAQNILLERQRDEANAYGDEEHRRALAAEARVRELEAHLAETQEQRRRWQEASVRDRAELAEAYERAAKLADELVHADPTYDDFLDGFRAGARTSATAIRQFAQVKHEAE